MPTPNVCTIPDCDRPTVARGYCALHYGRWRKLGDPLRVRKPHRTPTPICTEPGCGARTVARGWCAKHYQRWRRAGMAPADP